MTRRHDILALGNAIVDLIAVTDDDFLAKHKLHKGAMALIDEAQAEKLYAAMGPVTIVSGGSAANTIVGAAALGARTAFIGKVKDDQLGQVFGHDIRKSGVDFPTQAAQGGPSTARCFVLVTPDAQRTMLTYLGACVELTPDDLDEAVIAASAVTYLEGYLYDPPLAKRAFLRAADVAHKAGRLVSLSLSDPFCVGRHRDAFLDLVRNHVDILFANEAEITSLYQTDDFDEAVRRVRGHARVAAITRGAKGSVVVTEDDVHVVAAQSGIKVVDTTGAGDLYAAGFLYGFTHGRDLATCAVLGGIAAGEIISHIGARPDRPLTELAAEILGPLASSPLKTA